jgi:hypothetical protein
VADLLADAQSSNIPEMEVKLGNASGAFYGSMVLANMIEGREKIIERVRALHSRLSVLYHP